MLNLVLASAILAAAWQSAAADLSRKAFAQCLREAVDKAANDKMGADAFPAFAHQNCDPIAAKLKDNLIAFDVKNGVPRNRAASDAQAQLDDYYSSAQDRLKGRLEIAAAPQQ